MENSQKKIEDVHQIYDDIVINSKQQVDERYSKSRFPYEVLLSADYGWTPCDIIEVDSEKELVKIICYHPDNSGWTETCQGGVFDVVVEMWRVRVRGE